MNARDLRKAIRSGKIISTVSENNLPKAPEDWPQPRRERMEVAIKCAALYIFRGYGWRDIRDSVSDKFSTPDPTKSRVLQYVKKGAEYLDNNGVFRPVG